MVFQDGFIEHIGRMMGIANMLNDIPKVSWEEARLAVWTQLERLDENQKQLASNASVMQEKIENKINKDIYEAHSKIRAVNKRLDDSQSELTAVRIELAKQTVKIGAIAGAICGSLSVILSQVIRFFLTSHATLR